MTQKLTVEQHEEIESLKVAIKEREDQISTFEKQIELYAKFKKLIENEDYKAVIQDGYLAEAERLGQAMTNPTIHAKEVFEELNDQFTAIRLLNRYLMYIENDGQMAEYHMESEKENLESDKNTLRQLEV